jgi:propanol-preferring alcohol dehydrogenase
VGRVERLGAGATGLSVGDRVALPWLGAACGRCRYCVSGWETLCPEQKNTGYSIDGVYAEYAVGDAQYAVPVPDGVDPLDAAPLTCAGVTTYKAVKVSGARSADLVSVVGVGGLGHLAIQYAAIAGATVVAVDVQHDKLDLAKRLGASHTVDASQEDPAEAVQRLGGADVRHCPDPPASGHPGRVRLAAPGWNGSFWSRCPRTASIPIASIKELSRRVVRRVVQ